MSISEYATRYREVNTIVQDCRRQRQVAKHTIETMNRRLVVMELMLNELEAQICQTCGGMGEVHSWIAHDESELIRCKQCNGSGLPDIIKNEVA